ncbi:uncharacterized protein LOC127259556 [Andrographis paniculata]|uniref:uncharacterized protein LOC127259556 n=1 Tax=Andrographis paniculata TaxID=175694 RepID=UPI0021E87754|nr:uncharacterized protein LOC127259556 [Andrographis paniculata]
MFTKESIFMGAMLCEVHCPFICFCKSSAAHLYSSGPLRLENTPHDVVRSTEQTHAVRDVSATAETCGDKQGCGGNGKKDAGNILKSCIRRAPSRSDVRKKRVQWMDRVGKQLAETKEFEPSETGDTDGEEESSSHCICVIL